ncbi:uncharacterized protein LOC122393124 [Amphibalanus amphitrite]|uniref:uncharacterized protein LOC122393124 n=1 Tax=Amphibalanus amphitrite TaxID=1232801 RepID=UPI001C926DE2|nr:uncharacterized protein LOC122393124 [Amphibalanus amphitrite]
MERGVLRALLPALLSALAVTGAQADKDLCLSEKKTSCDGDLTLIGGTCVETDWDDATTCVKDASTIIVGRWYFPAEKDICNLDECFCYCNEHNYFFTVFFPSAPSSPRRRNNDNKLVPGKKAKCLCHNHAGKVTGAGNPYAIPLEQCGDSPEYAIIITNGISKAARAATYSAHYDCARFVAGTRSQAMAAGAGLPPGLGPTKTATEQCLEGQVCYNAGTAVNGPVESARKQTECYCNCFKQGYFFGAWNEKGNRCQCSNRKIKRAATKCRDDGSQLKVLKRTSTLKRVCCEAVNEKPPTEAPPTTAAPTTAAPEGGSRSSPVAGGPPPLGGSRSSPVAGGPPPPGGSRSTPMAGGPPPAMPGSRSTPMSGGPPALPESPKTPTVGIADEPDFVIPDDIDLPDPDLPPYDPNFFFDYPPEPLPDTYLFDLILPPEQPDWPPPSPPDQEPDIYIVYLPYLENPTPTPTDITFFVDPPIYEFDMPAVHWEYPDPVNWWPDPLLLQPEPLDWIWPLDPSWDTYWPSLDSFFPSMMTEPSVIYSYF